MSLPSADASTAARVRGLFADVIELAQVRFELFTVEARHGSQANCVCSRGFRRTATPSGTHRPKTCSRLRVTPGA